VAGWLETKREGRFAATAVAVVIIIITTIIIIIIIIINDVINTRKHNSK
jgi:hypothetical protein